MVFDYLRDDDDDETCRIHVRPYYSLCLTSRSLRATATPHLYQHFYQFLPEGTILPFVRTICKNPKLADLIRAAVISNPGRAWPNTGYGQRSMLFQSDEKPVATWRYYCRYREDRHSAWVPHMACSTIDELDHSFETFRVDVDPRTICNERAIGYRLGYRRPCCFWATEDRMRILCEPGPMISLRCSSLNLTRHAR